ncbi:MAG: class I SAM-dependent methyltransferase [Micropruina sp.]
MSAPVSSFPSPALGWLTDLDLSPAGQLSTLAKRSSVLVVGQHSAAPATTLHQHRVRLTVIDSTREGVGRMLKHTPSAIPVTAAASSLPFVPCSFDTVLIAQGLHLLDPEPALAEFARVLRPGGHVAICYTTRDDSVPWVRRLIALLREVDSSAMAGAYGSESVAALASNPYFPHVERRSFRQWVPVDEHQLVAMVARTPLAKRLDRADNERLLEGVRDLYLASARSPEPLLLPYQVLCWRGWVDHSELSAALHPPDHGLQITL